MNGKVRRTVVSGIVCAMLALAAPAASALDAGVTAKAAAATLSVDPPEALPGSPIKVSGAGLPPSTSVDLLWSSIDGDDVRGWWTTNEKKWGVTTDASGSFALSTTAPWDVGGPPHDVTAVAGSTTFAKAQFTIARKATMSPTSGPEGTEVTVKMIGMGVNDYDRVVNFVYDNAVVGYSCNTMKGNTTIYFKVAGGVGRHSIRLVPTFYKGPDAYGPAPWRRPVYNPDDLPTKYPTWDFEFEITGSSKNPPVYNVAKSIEEIPVTGNFVIAPSPAVAVDNGTPQIGFGNSGKGVVGGALPLALAGFPPGATVDLKWHTVSAKPVLNGTRFDGWSTSKKVADLGQITAGSDGKAVKDLVVPNDFSAAHQVDALVNGELKTTGSFFIIPRIDAKLSADGRFVEVHARGLGSMRYTGGNIGVLWDAKLSGVITAIMTGGEAKFSLPVVGTPGRHSIEFRSSSHDVPYMNIQESTVPWIGVTRYEITIDDPNGPQGTSPAAATDLSLLLLVLIVGLLVGLVAGRMSKGGSAPKPAPKERPGAGGKGDKDEEKEGRPNETTKKDTK